MQDERIDASVLVLLNEAPGPWQMEELEREFGAGVLVGDAVGRLVATGLAHRLDEGFVFASAAGRYAHSLGRSRL